MARVIEKEIRGTGVEYLLGFAKNKLELLEQHRQMFGFWCMNKYLVLENIATIYLYTQEQYGFIRITGASPQYYLMLVYVSNIPDAFHPPSYKTLWYDIIKNEDDSYDLLPSKFKLKLTIRNDNLHLHIQSTGNRHIVNLADGYSFTDGLIIYENGDLAPTTSNYSNLIWGNRIRLFEFPRVVGADTAFNYDNKPIKFFNARIGFNFLEKDIHDNNVYTHSYTLERIKQKPSNSSGGYYINHFTNIRESTSFNKYFINYKKTPEDEVLKYLYYTEPEPTSTSWNRLKPIAVIDWNKIFTLQEILVSYSETKTPLTISVSGTLIRSYYHHIHSEDPEDPNFSFLDCQTIELIGSKTWQAQRTTRGPTKETVNWTQIQKLIIGNMIIDEAILTFGKKSIPGAFQGISGIFHNPPVSDTVDLSNVCSGIAAYIEDVIIHVITVGDATATSNTLEPIFVPGSYKEETTGRYNIHPLSFVNYKSDENFIIIYGIEEILKTLSYIICTEGRCSYVNSNVLNTVFYIAYRINNNDEIVKKEISRKETSTSRDAKGVITVGIPFGTTISKVSTSYNAGMFVYTYNIYDIGYIFKKRIVGIININSPNPNYPIGVMLEKELLDDDERLFEFNHSHLAAIGLHYG
jgi:hypothetical protein